ncbi:MAG: HPr family phosphocarrier protein [Candidatus Omnitrophica bacterium]|nr:HPr family phosphocarrier protein [Candidatus Omnitrophota bacterium]
MKSKLPESPREDFIEKKIIIKNKLGLHARPAALFVQATSKYDCDLYVRKGKQKVNGKSIMGLMMLAAGNGTALILEASGPDARKAIADVEKLVSENFGE